jgi:hypothetical protein
LRGKQVPLAKGKRSKREAEEAFHRLMAVSAMDSSVSAAASATANRHSLQVVVLLDQFLDWVQQNLDCYEWHRRFIQDFADACAGLTTRCCGTVVCQDSLVDRGILELNAVSQNRMIAGANRDDPHAHRSVRAARRLRPNHDHVRDWSAFLIAETTA